MQVVLPISAYYFSLMKLIAYKKKSSVNFLYKFGLNLRVLIPYL